MDFDERYRIIATRDPRFDGRFVTAVHTTGIYCRPSCPARTPKRGNVSFFTTSAAAHEAGFRACKRCLPEATPGTPEWNLRDDLASRAMRLIQDGVVEREGVAGLASRLGYSSRHLTRALTAQLGAGPLALSRAHRAHTARALLTATTLPVADVAFAAGFASVRQFNDTIAEVFALTPTQVRARHRQTAPSGGAIELALPVREPFDSAGVFAWLAARAVPGVEEASADRYSRTLALPGGPARFTVTSGAGSLRLSARLAALRDLPALVSRVRRLFDLDADPAGIDAALAHDPAIAPHVARRPGMRLPGTVDPHEMVVRAIVGQQISVAAARTQLHRLALAAGTDLPSDDGGPDRLFPSPERLARLGASALVGPRARIDTLLAVTRDLADGTLEVGYGDDGPALRARLLARRGIGPWTADYLAMRVLGNPDVLLPGDSALRAGARKAGFADSQRELVDRADASRPWRSYLCMHLWAASAEPPPPPGRPTPLAQHDRMETT